MNIRLVNERWLDLAESAAASSAAPDPAPVDPAPQAAGDWPPIPQRVSFVATGCHSERELALAGYMAAAAAARFRAAADARLYSGILADPDLLLDAAVVAGNLFRKGVTKFSEFRDALLRKLGKPIEQYVESLYVKQLVDSMVEQGRRLKATGGRELSVTVERDLTERAVRSVMNEQPEDLKKLLAEVKNRYGSEVESEIKRRVNEAVKNIHEGRRSVEVHDLLGGHTLEKHVGQSKQRLLDRFKRERDLRYASSFASRDLADWAQREFIACVSDARDLLPPLKAFVSGCARE